MPELHDEIDVDLLGRYIADTGHTLYTVTYGLGPYGFHVKVQPEGAPHPRVLVTSKPMYSTTDAAVQAGTALMEKIRASRKAE